MKTFTLIFLFTNVLITASIAQNTFPATGRVGINTLTPVVSLQVKGGARIGTLGNYLKVDSATGNLSFVGTAGYTVANNQYAFLSATNPKAGLYFNVNKLRYEFRDTTGSSVLNINANSVGNVGIGITPAYKLDVKGDINQNVGSTIRVGGIPVLKFDSAHLAIWVGGGGMFNTTGYNNVANGFQALYSNTTGHVNTANGYSALYSNTTGDFNTANGSRSLYSNTTGDINAGFGDNTLYSNTIGSQNVAIGSSALYSNTTGEFNTANGVFALYSNTTGNANTANGMTALYSNITGNENSTNGVGTLYSNTTGGENTANGYYALYYNSNGSYNVGNGYEALYHNTTGYNNVAEGAYALLNNTTGVTNNAFGYGALTSTTTGSDNTAVGTYALRFNAIGNANTATGNYSLFSNTGDGNTAFGDNALAINTSGSYNTGLGSAADVSTGNLVNATAIGNAATVDASNKVRIGNTAITSIGGQVGWTTFSDGRYKKNIKEDVKGLIFINSLRPITYTVDINSLDDYYNKGRKNDSTYQKAKAAMHQFAEEASKIVYNGFVAQEVETAAKKINYDFSGVDKPQTKDGLYGLRYSDFVVPLVKAVQELSQQNNELQKQINELKTSVNGSTTNGMIKLAFANSNNTVLLGQNIPNPFDHNTLIPFRIPGSCRDASIAIAETATGKIIHLIPVSCTETQLSFDAGTLASGNYSYSLYVDGKLVQTKQMVLTK